MNARYQYDRYWADYSSTGPVNWRGSHHRLPDQDFLMLCTEADRCNLTVALAVGKKLREHGDGKRRDLTAIELANGKGKTVIAERIDDGNLRAATENARNRLADQFAA